MEGLPKLNSTGYPVAKATPLKEDPSVPLPSDDNIPQVLMMGWTPGVHAQIEPFGSDPQLCHTAG